MKRGKIKETIDSFIKGEKEFAQFAEKYSQESEIQSRELEIEIKEKINEIIYLSNLNRAIVDSLRLTLITTNTEGIITGFNIEAEKLLGHHGEDLIGKSSLLLLFKDEELAREASRLSGLRGKQILPGVDLLKTFCEYSNLAPQELKFLRKDKSEVNVLSSLSHLRSPDGSISGFLCIAFDNTTRKENEMLLKMQNAAFESFALAVIITDINGDILWANPAFTKLTGYSLDEVIGKNVGLLNSGQMYKEFFRELWKTILSGKVWTNEIINKKKDGSLYYEEETISPIFDEEGKVTRFIAIKIDITTRKEFENILLKSELVLIENLKKEKELGEMKSRFVSIASHEFRTPLASILLTSDGLLTYWNRIPEHQIKHKLSKIKNHALHLSSIVNEVLQLSKISDGNVVINHEKVDFIELCNQIVDSFNVDLKFKRIKIDSPLKFLVMDIDKRLITQAINNLISNALKYSPENTLVIVSIEKEAGELCVSVSDNGIGISEADQENIFTPFFRGSNTGTIQGTGLGLNIAQESIQLHGGSISLISNPGQGTRFTIHFPDKLIIK
jgi:PAS domain S-box-containing protein